ncbi:MAG: hypothetical protein HC902_03610 [Calothrix sp. SM1_5_4]|nr:hypothetical protein [Calothrix sp. SM1_5_4]
MVGTLVAVAIGGIVASLVATVISDAVKGQRAIIDRDEMSEFALFVKGLLTTDSTCNSLVAGKQFSPGGSTNVSFGPVGYGDNPSAVLQEGFKFSRDTLTVRRLTIEDKGLAPVGFTVPLVDPVSGAVNQVAVNRYVARVRLSVSHINETIYRDRFFEFPVLVDSTNAIRACNNELNVADACQALGFIWDTSGPTPVCVPQGACLSGGSYATGPGAYVNPATGGYSCPSGFTAFDGGRHQYPNPPVLLEVLRLLHRHLW